MSPRMLIVVRYIITIPTIVGIIGGDIAYIYAGPPNPDMNFVVGFIGSFCVAMGIGVFSDLAYKIRKYNQEQ